METLSKPAVGKAHGKVILIGEHAVVYQMPAIALPFLAADVTVTIKPKTGDSFVDSAYFTGRIQEAPATLYNFVETLNAVCDSFDETSKGLYIKVDSQIPAERGMGSSAAIACALVRALFSYFDREINDELLYKFISISETIAHGNPSGIDTNIVSVDTPLYYIKGTEPKSLSLNLPGFLITADTGLKGQTKEAVNDVGELFKKSRTKTEGLIHSFGQLTNKAKSAIENHDIQTLGDILTKAHGHLTQLTVSNRELDTLVQTALSTGALGAKLTGGGRGGCMIALAKNVDHAKEISRELLEAGAKETWIHNLGDSYND